MGEIKKWDLETLRRKRAEWESVNIEQMKPGCRERFEKSRLAVDLYIDGKSGREIRDRTGLGTTQVQRAIRSCITMDDEGHDLGYAGLIKNRTTKNHSAKGSCYTGKGAFRSLLATYPELAAFIRGNLFGDKAYTRDRRMAYKTLHAKFLRKLEELGVKSYEYPFNTEGKAESALYKYLKEIEKTDANGNAHRIGKNASQKLLTTGYGDKYSVSPSAPYQCVQLDGHRLDIMHCVEIREGDRTTWVNCERMWLITVIDTATRCILGYSVTPLPNYTGADVLKAIRNAIEPKTPPVFTRFKKLEEKYPENGGFPDTMMPMLGYAKPGSIMMDNAKSQVSANTCNRLMEIGMSIGFGSVATPETRGLQERVFRTLEEGGFHKLSMTTGSNPQDPRRHNPERNSRRAELSSYDIEEVLAYLIAVYNNSSHSALNGKTPLQAMKERIEESGMYPEYCETEQEKDLVHHITDQSVIRTVSGSIESGRRPTVSFEGCAYRGPRLSADFRYAGQKVTVVYDPEDISHIRVYSMEGILIDELKAEGAEGNYKHSEHTRKIAKRYARENRNKNKTFSSNVGALEDDLELRAKKSKRAGTELDNIRREQGLRGPAEVLPFHSEDALSQESEQTDYEPAIPETDASLIRSYMNGDVDIDSICGLKQNHKEEK